MGMLAAALLQGASQGMNVLGQSMQRDLDRQDEQAIWEKRSRMLAEIQAESTRTQRADQAAFDDSRFPVKLEQAGQITAAEGNARTAADIERATNPELIAAQDEAARRATQREIDALVQKANNPDLTAAERRTAQSKLEDLKAEVKIRGDGAIRVANATRAPREGARSISDQLAEKEKAIGRALSQQEREAIVLGSKGGDGVQAMRMKLAEEAANKALDNGSLKPEGRAKFVQDQLGSYGELEAAYVKDELLRQARASNDTATFIQRMRSQGADEATLLKLGVTKDEIRKAASSPKKESSSARQSTVEAGPPEDKIGNQPIGMLTRQADIEESARAGNRRAIEYLRRQEAGRLENMTRPRDAGSMMNGG